jgi:hypothetical protein
MSHFVAAIEVNPKPSGFSRDVDRHSQDPGHRLDRSFLHPTWLCCPRGRTDFQRHSWSPNNITAHGSDASFLLLYNKNTLELCFGNWVATGGLSEQHKTDKNQSSGSCGVLSQALVGAFHSFTPDQNLWCLLPEWASHQELSCQEWLWGEIIN